MAMVTRPIPTNELMAIEKASRALAEAKTIGEIKEIRDKAEAVRKYAQSAALGLSAQNHAAEVKLRAERKAGGLLANLKLRGGDRRSNNQSDCLTLDDLGISQNQSTRWQLQSRLPESEFEEYLRTTRESGREIASTAVLRLARQITSKRVYKADRASSVKNGHSYSATNGHMVHPHHNRGAFANLDEGLIELSHHHGLLNQLLKPLYDSNVEIELLPAQRRVLGHILREMELLICDMRAAIHRS